MKPDAPPPPRNATPSVLLESKVAELKRLRVPIQYVQLDDWWYQTGSCGGSVCDSVGCSRRFEPRPEYDSLYN